MATTPVHAFGDDALGGTDAVGLARQVRTGERSARELAAAALARAEQVAQLGAVAFRAPEPRYGTDRDAPLFGVPTYVKDNTDVTGMPSNHGSAAWTARPARHDGRYTTQFLAGGLTVLGKSRLPEFGFNASTEFVDADPTRNPWQPDHSSGASSGGAAALVAAGVVPIAHGNDGGGSIRIPAACCGLVGLKPSRGRHVDGESARHLPVNLISEGVLTRSVRDTAAFTAASERYRRAQTLPAVGSVEGPGRDRLRIGLVLDSVVGAPADDETRAAVERTARTLEGLGHTVEPVGLPVGAGFADDFARYWGMLAFLATTFGKVAFDRRFDASRTDPLTRGLRAQFVRQLRSAPGTVRRLRAVPQRVEESFAAHRLVLSPVLAHPAPLLGELTPAQPFDELFGKLREYVTYTPLANVAGTPAISLPAGLSAAGMPLGVQLSAARGDERTLLEVAYELEAEQPFPRIAG